MIENVFAPENSLFLVALGLFLFIFVVQFLGLVMGMEPFGFLDSVLPDVDLDIDTDMNLADATPSFVDSIMSMLKLGRVPFIFSFILFLFLFSLVGLYGQLALHSMGPGRIHWMIASVASFVITLPLLRVGNSVLAKVLPKDETSAISSDTFIGRVAMIVIGTATHERAAEAKLIGPEGKAHYLQVVADRDGKTFSQGEEVLVVGRRNEGIFTVINPPNPLLGK